MECRDQQGSMSYKIPSSRYVQRMHIRIMSGPPVYYKGEPKTSVPTITINSMGVKRYHVNPSQLLSLSRTRLRAGDLGHDIFHLDFDDLIWLTLQHSLKICNCFLMAGHAVGLWR